MKVIVGGKASGKILKTNNPINFLAAIDKKTGIVLDDKNDLYRKSIRDSILVFPYGAGSSVGAYTIYSLKSNNTSPIAMICQEPDLTVASGCAIANIPLIIVSKEKFEKLEDGKKMYLDTESKKIS